MKAITISSPAKLNLFLEVLGRRPDGFHEIKTVMQEIDLADRVRIRLQPAAAESGQPPIRVECRRDSRAMFRSSEPLPCGAQNIAFRAAEAMMKRAAAACARRLARKAVHIRISKRIPLASGMGGGSSNAAATLIGLDKLLGLRLSRRSLLSLSAGLGSDVPFFLRGGMAVCAGRGEKTRQLEVAGVLHFVILVPPWGLSTACVYEEFDRISRSAAAEPAIRSSELRARGSQFAVHSAELGVRSSQFGVRDGTPRLEAFLAALKRDDVVEIGGTMFNSLEAPAFRVEPRMAVFKERMEKLGFLRVTMTGSGSAIFGLCRGAAHAVECARQLRRLRMGSVFVARGVVGEHRIHL